MTDMARTALELGPTDRSLLMLPLFHVNGVVVSVLTPLLAGAGVVIQGWRFADDGTAFLGASSVIVERYRYRGARIPTPWTIESAAGTG